uniref:Uncharacterized protein n=2 Tax=Gasterosteus aculeatus TaxID=69293 RepID=G3N5T7_GASAC
MDHLSTMKRKNVVLVYDLLLEMLDANTTTSSGAGSQPSSSPTSDTFYDHNQYGPPPPAHQQPAGQGPCGPPENPMLDGHLEASPPFRSNDYIPPEPWSLHPGHGCPTTDYMMANRVAVETALEG